MYHILSIFAMKYGGDGKAIMGARSVCAVSGEEGFEYG